MSSKGKGKEVEPIVLSDSDSDADFFTSKRKVKARINTPPPKSPSPVRLHSDSSDSGESPEGEKKKAKKKKKTVRAPGPQLPAWTRSTTSHEGRGRKGSSNPRGSTEERRHQPQAIVIEDDSDDDAASSQRVRRKRVEVTPPPPISDQRKEYIRKALATRGLGDGGGTDNPLVTDDAPGSSSPPRDLSEDQIVIITVTMEVDPAKRGTASEAALKEWQKSRKFRFCKTDPLSKLLDILAHRIGQSAEDLVLEYNTDRVYNRTTPEDLNIDKSASFTGYTKSHYEQVQKDRRARILELDDESRDHAGDTSVDINARYTNPNTNGGTGGAHDQKSYDDDEQLGDSFPTGEGRADVRIQIRGQDGDKKVKVPRTFSAGMVLRFYVKQVGRSKEDVQKMRLVFDGETISPDTPIGDLELEDGDIIEVQE